MKWFLFLGGWLIVALVGLNIASAQEENKTEISVAPAIVEIAGIPGTVQTRQIYITNGSNESLPLSIETQSLINYSEYIIDDVALSDASEWITPTPNALIVGPEETKKVDLTFQIPDNAFSGGHYAQVNVRVLVLQDEKISPSSIVIPEIAVTSLVVVPGDLQVDFAVDQQNLFSLFSEAGTNQELNFSISNNGNTHSLATPVLILKNNKDKEVYRKQLTSQLILPNTSKDFVETWKVPDQHGRYTASIELAQGESAEKISTDEEVVIVSFSLFDLVVLGILTVSVIYLFNHRKNIKKAFLVLRFGKTDN